MLTSSAPCVIRVICICFIIPDLQGSVIYHETCIYCSKEYNVL